MSVAQTVKSRSDDLQRELDAATAERDYLRDALDTLRLEYNRQSEQSRLGQTRALSEKRDTNIEAGTVTKILRAATDIQWLARRYADRRRSYAVEMCNEATQTLLTLGVNLKPDKVYPLGKLGEEGEESLTDYNGERRDLPPFETMYARDGMESCSIPEDWLTTPAISRGEVLPLRPRERLMNEFHALLPKELHHKPSAAVLWLVDRLRASGGE